MGNDPGLIKFSANSAKCKHAS